MTRDCSTCLYRQVPDDVDWSKDPCETCLLLHLDSKTPWPMWRQRTPAQVRADAAALRSQPRKEVVQDEGYPRHGHPATSPGVTAGAALAKVFADLAARQKRLDLGITMAERVSLYEGETLPAVQPAPKVPSLPVMLVEAAILDAQLRAFERGRLDTPDEIKAAARAALKEGKTGE